MWNQRFLRALASVTYRSVEIVAGLPFFVIAVCVWIAVRFESKKE
jgi:hypothetical protein